VSGLPGLVTVISGHVSGLPKHVTVVPGHVSGLPGLVTGLPTLVTVLQGPVTMLQGPVTMLQTSVTVKKLPGGDNRITGIPKFSGPSGRISSERLRPKTGRYLGVCSVFRKMVLPLQCFPGRKREPSYLL